MLTWQMDKLFGHLGPLNLRSSEEVRNAVVDWTHRNGGLDVSIVPTSAPYILKKAVTLVMTFPTYGHPVTPMYASRELILPLR